MNQLGAVGVDTVIKQESMLESSAEASHTHIRKPNLAVEIPVPSGNISYANPSSSTAPSAITSAEVVGISSSGKDSVTAVSRSVKKRSRSSGSLHDLSMNANSFGASPRAPLPHLSSFADGSVINNLYYFSGVGSGNNSGANTRLLPALLCHRILNGLLVHGRLSLQSLLSLMPDGGGATTRDHVVQILELLCVLDIVQCMRVKEEAAGTESAVQGSSSRSDMHSTPTSKHTQECVYALKGHAKGNADVPSFSGSLQDSIRAKEANVEAIRKRVAALTKLSNDISGHSSAGSYHLRQKRRQSTMDSNASNAASDADSKAQEGNAGVASAAAPLTRSGSDPWSQRAPLYKHRTDRIAQFKLLVDSFIASNASLQDDPLYRALEQGGLPIGGRFK